MLDTVISRKSVYQDPTIFVGAYFFVFGIPRNFGMGCQWHPPKKIYLRHCKYYIIPKANQFFLTQIGYPQLSAVMECSEAAHVRNVLNLLFCRASILYSYSFCMGLEDLEFFLIHSINRKTFTFCGNKVLG